MQLVGKWLAMLLCVCWGGGGGGGGRKEESGLLRIINEEWHSVATRI